MNEIEATKLNIGYPGKVLAENVTFSLAPGEIMSVLGPNGIGKSTLLKTMLSMITPVGENGEIRIEGTDLNDLTQAQRARKISALLTERFSAGNLDAREVVEAGRYPYTGHFGALTEDDKRITKKVSQELEISDLLDKKYSTLSDGQKQRVLLARALCQEPRILILDEPFSYLDINYRLKISKYLVKKAHEKNISIILTIQEPSQAYAISDQVLLLFDDGHFEFGTKEEILTEEKLRCLYHVTAFKFDRGTKNFIL